MSSPRSLVSSSFFTDRLTCEAVVNTPLLFLCATLALFFWRRNGPVVRARGTVRYTIFMSIGLTCLQSVVLRMSACSLGPVYDVVTIKILGSLSLVCALTGGFLLTRSVFLRVHKLTMARLLNAASSGARLVDKKTRERTQAIARFLRSALLRAYFFMYLLVSILSAVLTSLTERDRVCGGIDCCITPGYWPYVFICVVSSAIPIAPTAVCIVGLRLAYRLHDVDTLGIRRLMQFLLLEFVATCVAVLCMLVLVTADALPPESPMIAVAMACFVIQVTTVLPEILQDYRYRNLTNSSVELPDFTNGCTAALRVFLCSSAENFDAFKRHVETEFCVEGVLFYMDVAAFAAAVRSHELNQAREQLKSRSSALINASMGSDCEVANARERALRDTRQRIIETYLLASSPLEINVNSSLTHAYRVNRAKDGTLPAAVHPAAVHPAAVHPVAVHPVAKVHLVAAVNTAQEQALRTPLCAHEFDALEQEALSLYTDNGTLQRFLANPRHKLLWDTLAATKVEEKRVADELESLRSQGAA